MAMAASSPCSAGAAPHLLSSPLPSHGTEGKGSEGKAPDRAERRPDPRRHRRAVAHLISSRSAMEGGISHGRRGRPKP
jgi:hypothetical protein